MKSLFQLLSFCAIAAVLGFSACKGKDEKPKDNVVNKTDSTINTAQTEPAANLKIKEKLKAYYAEISSGALSDESKYFAPTLRRFFKSENISREQAAQSIRKSMTGVERTISLEDSSFQIQAQGEEWVVEFEGKTEGKNSKDNKAIHDAFRNKITFDKDLNIVAYEQMPRTLAAETVAINALANDIVGLISAGKANDLGKFIAANGIAFVYRPGAINAIQTYPNFAKLSKEHPHLKEYWGRIKCQNLENAPAPAFDCDKGWAKKGCFLSEVSNVHDISQLMKELNKVLDENSYSARDVQRTIEVEKQITHVMVLTEGDIILYLGKEGDALKLLAIDIAKYDCSA